MAEPIAITAIASVSPLGAEERDIWTSYTSPEHCIAERTFGTDTALVASLPEEVRGAIDELRNEDLKYRGLDDSVLFALYVSRKAIALSGWGRGSTFGINIGSSRGATGLFETYHKDFLERGKAHTLSSPTTTLGNISSWIAHDLQSDGPEISHSITCATALHAVLNGVAWLRGGMAGKFLVGGSEAPLTPFTIAQMKALKVYAREMPEDGYPCRALDTDKQQNSMVLGEGAAVACLERGMKDHALAYIEGVGYATEMLRHNTSITEDADCFQRSMKMALGTIRPEEVDVVVMHAPGTIRGDASERNAIKRVFGEKLPALTTNKWKVGHSFGASGMLSLEFAVLMLKNRQFVKVPFDHGQEAPQHIRKIMVNAVGFGGNAVSILLGLSG
ncbi:beta-ketoacyl synthase N-terminal-like domain-containing protein [Sinomicrobium soli]|uniref:beta-ketoacyl synthase N-terminal-like domain-containing protein n=1 Tax=Sinomicrobium sp. N-1-3-6 TaxID=2219864 RepID=UPI000DCC06AE|nr:beta-ketoacyl synthase N-terminal-like domain-containing protein [Sinomicrobium sp. N-1-3-6]RAV29534.1 beta-ketoacyl synthase [Sinomicrobium sp. N-1-3-6]